MPASQPVVIGLGELLWDVFPDEKRTGGAPANVAFQANQLGCRGLLATRVGTDESGDELLARLQEKGLDLSVVQRDPKHPTGRVTVTLAEGGQPEYEIHEQVAWDYLEADAPLQSAVRSAAAICFGTLAQRNERSRETIHQLLSQVEPETLVVYDVNLRQKFYKKEWIERSLGQANVVKLNDDEVSVLAPLLDLPSEQRPFAEALIEQGAPEIVCITRGAKGCLVVTEGEAHEIPGRPVKVADSVGAGDAFTAGLIAGLLENWPLGLAAEFANRVGGTVASRQGAMPELRDEFRQLLDQYRPA